MTTPKLPTHPGPAAARIVNALADALDRTGDWDESTLYALRTFGSSPHDVDAAAALLAAARRETHPDPRVWLPGDTVPAGVAVVDESGVVWPPLRIPQLLDRPVVEVSVPDFACAVAAAQARGEALSAAVPPAAAATDDSAGEPHEAVSGASRAQESASQRLRSAALVIEQWAALGPPLAAWLRTEANTDPGDLPPGVTRVVTATSLHAQTGADLILAGETR